jgi:hypothetical protein
MLRSDDMVDSSLSNWFAVRLAALNVLAIVSRFVSDQVW